MAKKVVFNKLLEPGCIGKVTTKNRLIKKASGTMLLGDDGYVNERHKAYYNVVAKGKTIYFPNIKYLDYGHYEYGVVRL
jgi:2,4-dienoyl-CoA reductase-like NADH-dependent reductase (Old Yellow Enzyme family)